MKSKEHKRNVQDACTARYLSKNPWMSRFFAARGRCNNPLAQAYHRYGGRGIKFLLTKDDMRTLWLRDNAEAMRCASIDRIDNDGPYSLANCRFIERVENSKKQFRDANDRRRKIYAEAKERRRKASIDSAARPSAFLAHASHDEPPTP